MQYLRARYYDPSTGQFTTVDPAYPQSGSRYGYVDGNPLNWRDPSGLLKCQVCANFAGGVLNVITFGQEKRITTALGVGDHVDRCSGAYAAGEVAGVVIMTVIPIKGGAALSAERGAAAASRAGATADRVVIGKVADLEAQGALRAGERTLLERLSHQGFPKANWAQNSGVLRNEMARGLPIRDASVNTVTGAIESNTGFLQAERTLLQSHGWKYDAKTNLWNPPT